jgi:glycosyltransferase involved in cell wall biosynthesis
MMTLRGHTVIHYGHEDSDVECTEHVTVLSREDYNRTYGDHDFKSKLFKFDTNDDAYKTFNGNAIREINERKQPGDILLAFWGAGHQAICGGAGSGMKVVEPGIGYPWGHFAEYKIFESYAMYHAFLQRERVAQCSDVENQWSKEAVIPNYFELCDFVDDVVPMKDRNDYFLFVGRIGTAKGVQYAIQMTERLGVQLLIAGQNAEEGLKEVGMFPPPKHVEIIGHVDAQKRKTLMANAKAVVCMSTFAEPFCGVHVEALMSGTPVITADWGAFTEINIHGVTGFRCRTLEQMVEAGRRIHEIDPAKCRTWAVENFSTDRVAEMYEAFFEGKMVPIPRPKSKVAVWCETKWALGRIGRAIKKYIPNVDLYDWSTNDDNDPLWAQGGWKQYDSIISNTSLHTLKELYGIEVTDEMRRRFVVIAHCPRFEGMNYFKETLKGHSPLSRYAGVSRETCREMENYDVEASYTPFGADTDVFPWTHKVTGPIRRIGIIGEVKRATDQNEKDEYVNIKGMDMFADICRRGGFEPVYIFGRDGNDLYKGIDALICCSQLEGGPLGIFEAASCGLPVLTRRVGNAQYVKGIATFDTADEALSQLDIWNGNVDGLREYTTAVTKEVRINWSMRTLILRHLVPVLENSQTIDFIEIGTSDFSTEIQEAMGRTGLSVEPIKHYLDALPDVEGVTKIRAAVSDYDGHINVYNVHPDLIRKYQLPDWVRGCNSVNNYHPTVLKLILEKRLDERELFSVERVPVMTFSTLIKKHNVRGCRYLKIDTEGHDVVILNSYLECVARGEFSLAQKIQFEANELTENAVIENILKKLEAVGYRITERNSCNIVVENYFQNQ